jgi:hypothetical protein
LKEEEQGEEKRGRKGRVSGKCYQKEKGRNKKGIDGIGTMRLSY